MKYCIQSFLRLPSPSGLSSEWKLRKATTTKKKFVSSLIIARSRFHTLNRQPQRTNALFIPIPRALYNFHFSNKNNYIFLLFGFFFFFFFYLFIYVCVMRALLDWYVHSECVHRISTRRTYCVWINDNRFIFARCANAVPPFRSEHAKTKR